jgi:hypothetical protein
MAEGGIATEDRAVIDNSLGEGAKKWHNPNPNQKKGSDGSADVPYIGLSNGSMHTAQVREALSPSITTQFEPAAPLVTIKEVFQKAGLDENKLTEVWRLNAPSKNYEFYVQSNLETIHAIESERPGISKVLFNEFGIENFGRYPSDVLIKQYDNRNNKDLQYGVMVMNKSDHNGAFNYRGAYSSMASQLEDLDYSMRIVEVNTKKEMFASLEDLSVRYGEGQKMEFAVIGGHGRRTGISLGRPLSSFKRFFHTVANMFYLSNSYELHKRDINNPLFQKIKGYFREDPTWLLWSCSTGKKKGIGEEISKEQEANVVAPRHPTNFDSINITKNGDGRLNFENTSFYDHRYYRRHNPKFLLGSEKPRIFRKGKVAS